MVGLRRHYRAVRLVNQQRKKFDLFSVVDSLLGHVLQIRPPRTRLSRTWKDVWVRRWTLLDGTHIEMMNSNNSSGHCISSLSQHPLIICPTLRYNVTLAKIFKSIFSPSHPLAISHSIERYGWGVFAGDYERNGQRRRRRWVMIINEKPFLCKIRSDDKSKLNDFHIDAGCVVFVILVQHVTLVMR